MVAVDFQKAYNSVSFAFLRTALTHVGLPQAYVSLSLSVMAGPVLFCVEADVELRPKSGIKGNPLSPLLFHVVTILLIHDLGRLHVEVQFIPPPLSQLRKSTKLIRSLRRL